MRSADAGSGERASAVPALGPPMTLGSMPIVAITWLKVGAIRGVIPTIVLPPVPRMVGTDTVKRWPLRRTTSFSGPGGDVAEMSATSRSTVRTGLPSTDSITSPRRSTLAAGTDGWTEPTTTRLPVE